VSGKGFSMEPTTRTNAGDHVNAGKPRGRDSFWSSTTSRHEIRPEGEDQAELPALTPERNARSSRTRDAELSVVGGRSKSAPLQQIRHSSVERVDLPSSPCRLRRGKYHWHAEGLAKAATRFVRPEGQRLEVKSLHRLVSLQLHRSVVGTKKRHAHAHAAHTQKSRKVMLPDAADHGGDPRG
jgi:hypothetical protein